MWTKSKKKKPEKKKGIVLVYAIGCCGDVSNHLMSHSYHTIKTISIIGGHLLRRDPSSPLSSKPKDGTCLLLSVVGIIALLHTHHPMWWIGDRPTLFLFPN